MHRTCSINGQPLGIPYATTKLAHWGRDKMASLCRKNFTFMKLLHFHWNFTDNCSEYSNQQYISIGSVQIMAWCWVGDKSLSELMVISFTEPWMRISAPSRSIFLWALKTDRDTVGKLNFEDARDNIFSYTYGTKTHITTRGRWKLIVIRLVNWIFKTPGVIYFSYTYGTKTHITTRGDGKEFITFAYLLNSGHRTYVQIHMNMN